MAAIASVRPASVLRSAVTVIVEVQKACDAPDLPPPAELESLLALALRNAGVQSGETEISIRIVGEEEIRALNKHYRHKDQPTNVLAFPASLDQLPGLPEDDVTLLGDIVLCAPVVVREAAEQDKAPAAHWCHLLVHGLLHLLGYDHANDEDALRMESLETRVLTSFGLANPYKLRGSS